MSNVHTNGALQLALLFASACSSPAVVGEADQCSVSVALGALIGEADGETCAFRGVPYAAPPLGTRRFAPPQPVEPWSGPRDASRFAASCMQGVLAAPSDAVQSEDCLYLNVFAPRATPERPLPVMVWIHGGAFFAGSSSSYDARRLAEIGPAIVVTINYRLGVFGYLTLPELDAEQGHPSGGDGIADQQAALRWVRDNIARFHGDPANVTVFGESAGAQSACIHLLSPSSKGLARRYILESGHCLFSSVSSSARAYGAGSDLVQAFCPSVDPLPCLRALDARTLAQFVPVAHLSKLVQGYYPRVDGPGGLLPDEPEALLERGEYDRDADILLGTNRQENGFFTDFAPAPTTVAGLTQAIDMTWPTLGAQVREVYPATTDAEAEAVYYSITTDMSFRCPARELAHRALQGGTRRIYLYSYEVGRAFHGDELPALFDLDRLDTTAAAGGITIPSPAFQATLQGYWTRFAASGDPNGPDAPAWPLYAAEAEPHLTLLDPTPRADAHLQTTQCEFWRAQGFPGWSAE